MTQDELLNLAERLEVAAEIEDAVAADPYVTLATNHMAFERARSLHRRAEYIRARAKGGDHEE